MDEHQKKQILEALADLKATVTLDGEIVTVTPSGDMARKHFYDRNMTVPDNYWDGSGISNHAWIVRWTYTVPTDKKYNNGIYFMSATTKIGTAGDFCKIVIEISIDDGSNYFRSGLIDHETTTGMSTTQTVTTSFFLDEDHIMRGKTYSNDDANTHGFYLGATGLEFDG